MVDQRLSSKELPSCCPLQVKYGEITYDTTFEDYTMLTGNVVSLMMGGIICYVWSMISPEDYDFVSMKQIKMVDMDEDGDMGFEKVRVLVLGMLWWLCSLRKH